MAGASKSKKVTELLIRNFEKTLVGDDIFLTDRTVIPYHSSATHQLLSV
jgi:hypothetical protein